eukprot:TRINITY_DN3094_c0_g1_i10.p1 TRINITY_DN3094_c0_g1~~TRINITY_DN3094_c0_g1_i10.p1  ORF type:complete len:237 (+),score=74.19 TRINITY_DN3094_c0_g1_i10:35-745(+)
MRKSLGERNSPQGYNPKKRKVESDELMIGEETPKKARLSPPHSMIEQSHSSKIMESQKRKRAPELFEEQLEEETSAKKSRLYPNSEVDSDSPSMIVQSHSSDILKSQKRKRELKLSEEVLQDEEEEIFARLVFDSVKSQERKREPELSEEVLQDDKNAAQESRLHGSDEDEKKVMDEREVIDPHSDEKEAIALVLDAKKVAVEQKETNTKTENTFWSLFFSRISSLFSFKSTANLR